MVILFLCCTSSLLIRVSFYNQLLLIFVAVSDATSAPAAITAPRKQKSGTRKPKGRARKHIIADSESDAQSQDENIKRRKLSNQTPVPANSTEELPVSSQPDTAASSSPSPVHDSSKRKEQVSKLEGLLNVLKSRKPLTDAADDQMNQVVEDGKSAPSQTTVGTTETDTLVSDTKSGKK